MLWVMETLIGDHIDVREHVLFIGMGEGGGGE